MSVGDDRGDVTCVNGWELSEFFLWMPLNATVVRGQELRVALARTDARSLVYAAHLPLKACARLCDLTPLPFLSHQRVRIQ